MVLIPIHKPKELYKILKKLRPVELQVLLAASKGGYLEEAIYDIEKEMDDIPF